MNRTAQFFAGFLSLGQGLTIMRQSPRVRGILGLVLVCFGVLVFLSQLWFGSVVYLAWPDLIVSAASNIPEMPGGLHSLLIRLAAIAVVFLAWAANLVLTWALMRLVLTFLLGLLAERILKHFGRATPGADRLWSTLATGLKRGLVLLLISMPFAVALLIPGLNLIAAGVFALILAADQMDFAMEALGWSLSERWAFLRHHRAAWLGLAAQLLTLSLIPFVGLLLLPFTVAGATIMVHRLAPANPSPVRVT